MNLEHPLSPGFGWHPTREQVEAIDTTMLQEIIDREPDFEHIAQAPACQHEDVVRGLRDLAGMFYWRQSEVSTLAGMLANAGCLTSDEYEWLARYAGREHRRAAAIQLNVFGRSDSEPDTPPT